MAALTQTVAIVNSSGKVVKTSKHLVNVFKEARSAYRERKAELRAARDADIEAKRAHHALQNFTFDETKSSASSRVSKSKSTRKPRAHDKTDRLKTKERAPMERGYSDSFYTNDERPRTERPRTKRRRSQPSSRLRFEEDPEDDVRERELVRRNTDGALATIPRRKPQRSNSESNIDMDLAYGELPPPLPARRYEDDQELKGKMTKLQQLLEEANCLQHSVTAMIANLEKNPDALAAVALTLAEISNLASKMAPGALMALKGSFPAAVALLASPEFAIAVGVGVGITIVALGGYKIIKKIKQKKEGTESPVEELQELEVDQDVSHIESWRRGIADVEAESVGTSVDGEFITPEASKQLQDAGKLRPGDIKEKKSSKSKSKSDKTGKGEKSKKKTKDRKEPSRLRQFFAT
ncbi:MAG: hypothetical protein M1820_008111 [Bogoriella megaspora]|nr:MAG: hypothetical protein M1820_008111 [Bogoriella megaspora]